MQSKIVRRLTVGTYGTKHNLAILNTDMSWEEPVKRALARPFGPRAFCYTWRQDCWTQDRDGHITERCFESSVVESAGRKHTDGYAVLGRVTLTLEVGEIAAIEAAIRG